MGCLGFTVETRVRQLLLRQHVALLRRFPEQHCGATRILDQRARARREDGPQRKLRRRRALRAVPPYTAELCCES
jgi:hypothetical protein